MDIGVFKFKQGEFEYDFDLSFEPFGDFEYVLALGNFAVVPHPKYFESIEDIEYLEEINKIWRIYPDRFEVLRFPDVSREIPNLPVHQIYGNFVLTNNLQYEPQNPEEKVLYLKDNYISHMMFEYMQLKVRRAYVDFLQIQNQVDIPDFPKRFLLKIESPESKRVWVQHHIGGKVYKGRVVFRNDQKALYEFKAGYLVVEYRTYFRPAKVVSDIDF